ncbi:hypothetical protein TanjilG_08639 [Lupinus angustifolius]|uniref:ZF-HD dimerization-type domain-containing protein n=1 Tax=Lupinus angustifolius TaxID=3871 RepID=A0A4P1R8Q8_LUPAN|nr:PREDICTED: zinc-finger homeodomain protein 11-like [Lupinus angustifolius]OIW04756.1 hypothetical protein TanjilG_08639 [Lupinus angustifolius]
MDLSPNNTHTLDKDTQTPPPTQPNNTKSSSFTNGSFKPYYPTTTTTSTSSTPPPPPPSTVLISYNECLKNHAANIGGHALDGCGEFMPSSSSNPSEPRSLTCAACGCHRNFHRRDNNPRFPSFYHSSPPLPRRGLSLRSSSPSSLSPSPISSSPSSPPPISHHFPTSYAVPHMLLSRGNGYCDDQHRGFSFFNYSSENKNQSGKKKRCRTKFSQEQKEKMHSLCEKLGWRMNKEDEGLIQEFCNEVGIPRGVFKVWMHNNKNIFKKRSLEMLGNAVSDEKINGNHNGNGDDSDEINNSLEHN